MYLIQAIPIINSIVGIEFHQIFTEEELSNVIIPKGRTGQLLEVLIGLKNTSARLDFTDGELKTNKVNRLGKPLETMFITQISTHIDEILDRKNFYDTYLYEKIRNLLYVPICKEGDPRNWMVLPPVHVELTSPKFIDICRQIEEDYYDIVEQLHNHIQNSDDGFIHTSNGEFIQIRSKDLKPYSPIYSNNYGRYISNKNHAFYFKKAFMTVIQNR